MDQKEFNEFQKSEYNHIATAHFETVKQVSEYIKYYLIIMSAPSVLLIFFGKDGVVSFDDLINSHLEPLNTLMGLFFTALGFLSFFVCWYIINIRHDAILYARTVNGIRKYFYEEGSEFDPVREVSYRVLPKKIFQPRYLEFTLFSPILFAVALINSSYLFCGLFLLFKTEYFSWPVIIGLFWLSLHFVLYFLLSYYRDNYYMRSHKIGIDIDGVLNKHREHFCKILPKVSKGKTLDPEKIDIIPIHENPSLGVTNLDEKRVFNSIDYWTEMPPIQEAFEELEKLKKLFGYKIYIFSKRDWPSYKGLDQKEIREYEKKWFDNDILSITKKWLKKHDISYDQLTLEKGNTDLSDTTFSVFKKVYWNSDGKEIVTNNRFQISKRKNIRFFVDDDPNIVEKLSNICDYVFLMNQPYNKEYKCPANVIRVVNWFEIYKHIRRLS